MTAATNGELGRNPVIKKNQKHTWIVICSTLGKCSWPEFYNCVTSGDTIVDCSLSAGNEIKSFIVYDKREVTDAYRLDEFISLVREL